MKKLINKLVHACGHYTADDVEHIEKHWRERLDKATTVDVKLVAGGGAGGGGYDARGSGGQGHAFTWYSRASEPAFIPPIPTPGQTLIIQQGEQSGRKGEARLTGAERRELAAEAVRWCKQQRIETSPENIIFYLESEKHLIRHTSATPSPQGEGNGRTGERS